MRRALIFPALALLCVALAAGAATPEGAVATGLGAYFTKPSSGMLGSDARPPVAQYPTKAA